VRTELAQDLPEVLADPEAIKRAVANLVDNAAEAMQDAILKEITISTALVAAATPLNWRSPTPGRNFARREERLFLPYFSTKQRGTDWAGDCEQNCGRPPRFNPGGREQTGRQPVRDRAAGGGGKGRAPRQARRKSVVESLVVRDSPCPAGAKRTPANDQRLATATVKRNHDTHPHCRRRIQHPRILAGILEDEGYKTSVSRAVNIALSCCARPAST